MDASVVIPNWNGKKSIGKCIDSLLAQSFKPNITVVENGSTDGSLKYIKENFPEVDLIINNKNLGFAGGVNSGIKKAIEKGDKFVALFNNDAIADKEWFKNLYNEISSKPEVGIATSKILTKDGKHIDSTGDFYTVWGLPFPRGRAEVSSSKYDEDTKVFAGSGGASIYRVSMLKEIGLFDEDFFAYYEDVDISFRAQLAGWKVAYVPNAIVYHEIGATSKNIKGFTTYHSMKNLQYLLLKNVPGRYFWRVAIRLRIALILFWLRAITRGQFWPATKGAWVAVFKTPKKLLQRHKIQSNKKVSDEYIWKMMIHDLPPNSKALKSLRDKWWKLTRRSHVNRY
ncbi:MAG: glycosyltransferase family 2 protein [Candidatus Saccharimonadales bacterium]